MGNDRPDVLVCIPARYGSSRFPGKPLAKLAGKPLIQHTYEAAQHIPSVSDILVVTDDQRIEQTVREFGGQACLVETPCRTGSDRVAHAVSHLAYDVIINLQADEIPLAPSLLTDLIDPFLASETLIGTLKRRIEDNGEVQNSSIVKVVTNKQGEALYFSRSGIPFVRDNEPSSKERVRQYMHLGIYMFRKDVLQQFAALPTGMLEEVESLEQLRALEYGIPIRVWKTCAPSLRIDTPEDLRQATYYLAQRASCES